MSATNGSRLFYKCRAVFVADTNRSRLFTNVEQFSWQTRTDLDYFTSTCNLSTYNLKARAQEVRYNLNKNNAVIDAIRSGKINKAELLSGKQLIEKDSVVQALVQKANKIEDTRQKTEENTNREIISQLRAIANKPQLITHYS